jgi:UDPglucose 6-dehydrogenase
VALLGLTFKAGTDDLRESPALRLGRELLARGASLTVHDPVAAGAGAALLRRSVAAPAEVVVASDVMAACRDADAVVVATEWPEYSSLDWSQLAGVMGGQVVVDARRIVDVGAVSGAGLRVLVLGVEVPALALVG